MSEQTLVPAGTPTVNTAWRVDVNTGTFELPAWVQVKGANSIAPNVNATTQDSTDYDTEGWGADAVTQRKWQIVMAVLRKRYSDAYDPGQEALRAAADSLELVHVRWYDRSGADAEAYHGYALVQWSPAGGDPTGLQTVNATLLGQGERGILGTNPSVAAAAAAVASVVPTGAAAGELVTIKGSGFSSVTGAAGVKFGSTNAADYTVVSDVTIVASLPAGSAGSAAVTVTNTVGASPAHPYTRA
jgi:hypothetical protein